MTSEASPAAGGLATSPATSPRVRWLASLVFLGVLPVLTVIALFASAIDADDVALDFRQFYAAAEAVVGGENPYETTREALTVWGGPYPYPPLLALFAIPLTVLSLQAAGLLVMAVLVGVAVAVPALVGVRDWRCYGVMLLWPPVISAIQTGNVTLWFALAAAIAWRFRDRIVPVAASIGFTLAAKFFLWPLVVWLLATRRFTSALWTVVAGLGLLLVSWAAIGFVGLTDYPHILRDLEDAVGADSYTAYIVGLDVGLPSVVARTVWLGVGLSLLAGTLVLGRRGEDRTAFVLAIAAALALTPIVWLHYFALLLVVVAVARPSLGLVWFVPLGMVLTPGSGTPTPFQTSWTLAVAALTIALAIRASASEDERPVPAADARHPRPA